MTVVIKDYEKIGFNKYVTVNIFRFFCLFRFLLSASLYYCRLLVLVSVLVIVFSFLLLLVFLIVVVVVAVVVLVVVVLLLRPPPPRPYLVN